MCSGDCLQECVLKHLDVAKAGARESDLSLTYARKIMQGSCVRQVYVHKLTLDPLCVRVCSRTRVKLCKRFTRGY